MVSTPVTGSLSLGDITQSCGTARLYGWSLAQNEYYTASSLTPGQGYWVRVDRSCQVPVSGTGWSGSVSLSGAGWHMVGAPAGGLDIGAIGGNCDIRAVWGWSPSAEEYIRPNRLEPGQGYWFRTGGSCTLNF